MKKKGLWLGILSLVVLLLAVVLAASPALGAQESTLAIKNMKVSVWPEYDDPRILVTYTGEFNNNPAFPQPVKFPVPTGSEILQVCALQPPNNEHLCQLYDTLPEGDGVAISYTLPIPTYYLEYYWNGIKAEADKSFSFNYVSPYTVDRLEIEVKQPLRATDFKPDERYTYSVTNDGQGMKNYSYVFNNVTPGQAKNIAVAYTKPDSTPSVAKQTSGQSGSTGGTAGGNGYRLIVGIGAALLAAVVIGMVFIKRRPAPVAIKAESRRAARIAARRAETSQHTQTQTLRAQSRPAPRAATAVRPVPAAKPAQTAAGTVFCRQCGTRLAPGAAFCHTCGEKTS